MATPTDNLWLAQALWDLGGVEFGSFTLGRTTVNSPIYINPRVLVSNPEALRRAAELIVNETLSAQTRRRPKATKYDLVAGVPFGGLHLATALSITANVPMIYPRSPRTGGLGDMIEGRFREGQTVLIIDDLITTGGSVLQTAALLEENGLQVRDAVVLVDREQGAADRLKRHGINLISILRLKVMLNYYLAHGLIESDAFHQSVDYLETNRTRPDRPPHDPGFDVPLTLD